MNNLIKLLLVISITTSTTIYANSANDRDFETIRSRIIASMMEQRVDDARIRELISTLRADGTWPGIDYADIRREGFQHSRHLSNMVAMCRAYKKQGSALRGRKELKNAIDLSLNYWLANDFLCDNWWNNEIGTPDAMTTILLVMDGILSKEQVAKASAIAARAHIDAWGARQSGDRIKITGIQAKNMLFKRDVETFRMLVKVIEGEMRFVPPNQRGMKRDYSFHHRDDLVNNTLSYGSGYADAFVEWTTYLKGTRYQLSETALNLLIDFYLDGMCKQMVFGKYKDPGVTNRDVSRRGNSSPSGPGMLQQLVDATGYRKAELQEIINIRANDAKTTLSFGKFFWMTEYYTHQRPGYFTSVRFFSSRNANMEEPYNGEGLLNHHRADGTNYISTTGTEYYDIAPVYDWQKIPGTTVMQKPKLPDENEIQKYGVMDFAGAVTNGMYGAVGFDFISPHDPLRARKAWFFFDNEYVCLGAGITSQTNNPVVTTVNQCLKRGVVDISSQQVTIKPPPPSTAVQWVVANPTPPQRRVERERTVERINWVHHDNVGYIFPEQSQIRVEDKPVTGNWLTINRQTSSLREDVTLDVFKLWIEHGPHARNATYQYIVMPGASKEQVAAAWAKPAVAVLSNTSEIQAVWHNNLNILQIVCYKNGSLQIPGTIYRITMHTPGIIMIKRDSSTGSFELSVADPSRTLGKVHLSVNQKIQAAGPDYLAVWNESKGVTDIIVDMPQNEYAGKSVIIK